MAVVVGSFDTQSAAETALHRLREAGFADEEYSLVSQAEPRHTGEADVVRPNPEEATDKAAMGAAIGLLAGGALLGPVGALIGGAAGGGLVALLTARGLVSGEAAGYEEQLRRGQFLVAVDTVGRAADARALLRDSGAQHVDAQPAPAAVPAGRIEAHHGTSAPPRGGEVQAASQDVVTPPRESLRPVGVPSSGGGSNWAPDTAPPERTPGEPSSFNSSWSDTTAIPPVPPPPSPVPGVPARASSMYGSLSPEPESVGLPPAQAERRPWYAPFFKPSWAIALAVLAAGAGIAWWLIARQRQRTWQDTLRKTVRQQRGQLRDALRDQVRDQVRDTRHAWQEQVRDTRHAWQEQVHEARELWRAQVEPVIEAARQAADSARLAADSAREAAAALASRTGEAAGSVSEAATAAAAEAAARARSRVSRRLAA